MVPLVSSSVKLLIFKGLCQPVPVNIQALATLYTSTENKVVLLNRSNSLWRKNPSNQIGGMSKEYHIN